MQKDKKLIYAWSVFATILFAFVVIIETHHRAHRERSVNHQYRILISKDLINMCNLEKQPTPSKTEKQPLNLDCELYEHTKYGYLPKIISNGRRVFDVYSAHFDNSIASRRIFVAIQIENTTPEILSETIKALGHAKITFILPHYLDKFDEIAKIIAGNGHELFIQIPTQSAIPSDKKNIISPLLANGDLENTLEKLYYLMASAKRIIGLANTTPTLLTKSKRDMTAICNQMTKRGLAFLDTEKNELLDELSSETGLTYHSVYRKFDAKKFDISDLRDKNAFVVKFEDLLDFLKISKDFGFAPISFLMKRCVMSPYRKCVAVLLVKGDNVLVCQRADVAKAWQLPQGGVEKNESYIEAAKRELFEETNVKTIRFVNSTSNAYKYDFPESSHKQFIENGKETKYIGQALTFVVFEFLGDDNEINVNKSHREFSSWRWIPIKDLSKIIVDFKKIAYDQAIKELKLNTSI
ncbi:MAG: RNA pyrophosphohydrolase [Holosporaceae bacterium]|jgi:putative (di)nucleoside polyphosphate hydrolase|nr:RNA pyrophosphohydrolase [Holosporaceae bacterium]